MFSLYFNTLPSTLLLTGQDEVRLWLVSPDLKASVVAQVTDWRNGTYLARSILPWAGNVIVKATIAHTRDVFRTVALTQVGRTIKHYLKEKVISV